MRRSSTLSFSRSPTSGFLVTALALGSSLAGTLACVSDLDLAPGCTSDRDCEPAAAHCDLQTLACAQAVPPAEPDPTDDDSGTAEDAGLVDGGGVESSAGCVASIRITNVGNDEGALPVLISLPALAGLRADATNLVVTGSSGAPLPFSIERATAAGASIFVRMPAFPRGTTEVLASACSNADGTPSARATFDYALDLDPALGSTERAAWATTCTSIDATGEVCAAQDVPTDTWVITSVASCSVAPFDGATTEHTRPLPVAPGRYALDLEVAVDAQHFNFCTSTAGTSATARVALLANAATTVLDEVVLPLHNCEAASSVLTSHTFPVTISGAPTSVSFTTAAGDCARVQQTTRGLRLRRLAAVEPRIEVVVAR